MKSIFKYLKVFLLLLGICWAYSVLVCMLPNKVIKKNIEKSVPELYQQGNYPYVVISKKQYNLDNYTDAIFLSQNFCINPKKPIRSAMLISLVECSTWNMPEMLKYQVEGVDVKYCDYPRYWCGNTFLLRPLLLMAHYSNIRWMLYALSSLASFLLCALLYKKVGKVKMFAFATGLICVNFFVTQFSLQFFTTFFLGIISCILICHLFEKRQKSIPMVFFVIGCLTSYFDLLTTPLVSLGLPLVVYLMFDKETDLKAGFKRIIELSTFWLIGFACMWASKWVLGTLLTDANVLTDAYNNILARTDSVEVSRFRILRDNLFLLPLPYLYLAFLVLSILSVFFFQKQGIKKAVMFLFVAIFPYVWYFVLANHSYIHSWFTYRSQAFSIISVLMAFISIISWERVKKFRFKRR